MRYPLWILNSILLLLLFAALFFIFFTRQPIPVWETIEPGKAPREAEQRTSEINVKKIYEYDLFETYVKSVDKPSEPDYVVPLPKPPTPKKVMEPKEEQPTFLDPLKITLKGITFFINDDTRNRVIVAETDTKKESIHKVGDIFEDAQLIKIFNNKAIFLRSNGQQEVLYLRQKDAQLDPAYAIIAGWKNVIQATSDENFLINPQEFSYHVNNLAQLIDFLGLTTVYKQGRSLGCRVGKLKENSLGQELGLETGDIILSINNTPATTNENRLKIYKEIVSLKTKDTIIVHLLRKNSEINLMYTLEEFKKTKLATEKGKESEEEVEPAPAVTEDQLSTMRQRYKFAPTVDEIRTREKRNMLRRGHAPRQLSSQLAE